HFPGMIDIRKFDSLGHADHGWLNARHHFSFASYHDPARMGWGRIRVWNDDQIAAQSGFPAHPHRDMEIVTYVRTGAITHQDSMGIDVKPDRHPYLVPSGRVRVNGVDAGPRDGVAITGEERVTIQAEDEAELVLVDAR